MMLFTLSSRVGTTRALLSSYSSRIVTSGRNIFSRTVIQNIHIRNRGLGGQRFHWSEYYKASTSSIYLSAEDDAATTTATEDDIATKSIDSTWNIGGLKKEVSRLTVRCHKKIGKANQRLTKANTEVDRLTSDPDVSLEELEKCPNIEGLEKDVDELRTRLQNLNKLEVLIQDLKGTNVLLPDHVAELAIDLEVNDEPPKRNPSKSKKKQKGPKNMQSFRLPYRRFYTVNKTEIRVS